jgi:hypothetical protein
VRCFHPAWPAQQDKDAHSDELSQLVVDFGAETSYGERVCCRRALNRQLVAKAEAIDSPHRVVLDMDSSAPGEAWERRMG